MVQKDPYPITILKNKDANLSLGMPAQHCRSQIWCTKTQNDTCYPSNPHICKLFLLYLYKWSVEYCICSIPCKSQGLFGSTHCTRSPYHRYTSQRSHIRHLVPWTTTNLKEEEVIKARTKNKDLLLLRGMKDQIFCMWM